MVMREWEVSLRTKSDHSDLQTEGDRFSEETLSIFLTKEFPEIGIRGEERAARESTFGREWVIDPIDGTSPFVAGMDNFSISVGLVEKGVPVFGLIDFPAQRKFIWGNNEGFFTGESVQFHLRKEGKLNEAFIGFDFSFGDVREDEINGFLRLLAKSARNVFIKGSFGGLLDILEGRLNAYVHPGATPFDLAASMVIAGAAGIWVARIDEWRIDLSLPKNSVIFSADQRVGKEILELVSKKKEG